MRSHVLKEVTGTKLRYFVFVLVMLVCGFLISAKAESESPGSLERTYLKDASEGKLENVFVVHELGGFFALPRTFVLVATDNLQFLVELHNESTLKKGGMAIFGILVRSQDGIRKDGRTLRRLPSMPTQSEVRGTLHIDYFEPDGEWGDRSVMIWGHSAYLLLTGSAVALTNEIAEAYVSLSGPPDLFSPGWHKLGNWSDLPEWGIADRPLTGSTSDACKLGIFRFNITVSDNGNRVFLRVFPGSNLQAFQATGFEAGDVILAADGRPVAVADDVFQLLRTAARGRATSFSVNRNGTSLEVVLTPAKAQVALAQCSY